MWLTFNKIDAQILIDCRDLTNHTDIMPTYKLAKEMGVIKKLIFSVDKPIFAFYFLQDLEYFIEYQKAVIVTDTQIYYLSFVEIKNSSKIIDIDIKSKTIKLTIGILNVEK
jgi:hypothetical protein